MKKCLQCKVVVNTNNLTCPLCHTDLYDIDGEAEEMFKPRPAVKNEFKVKRFLSKLFLFLSVVAVVVCGTINLLTSTFPLWSLVVAVGIVYVWVLVAHTIFSRRGIFEKLFLQTGVIIGLLFACEWVANDQLWMIDYVIPSITMLVAIVSFVVSILIINKRCVLAFLVLDFILTLTCAMLLICNVTTFNLINIFAVIVGVVFMLGIVLFCGNAIKGELSKKVHI